ncbi:hypothetical protein ATANTOWER_002989 [Ataeniobius toweri]|uniref:Uncharacterized protein n=1 Tax=Ataeniobius toweri TaxID=208326 RepID=A0ABU7BWZ8_9TELE|nr:hypothetical protein [Ataeniobius toweri]
MPPKSAVPRDTEGHGQVREQVTKTVSEWKTKVADHGLRAKVRWPGEPRKVKGNMGQALGRSLSLAIQLDLLTHNFKFYCSERKPSKAQLCRAAEVVGW